MIVQTASSDGAPFREDQLVQGVLLRRLAAWIIDAMLIGALMSALFSLGLLLGLLTLGITLPVLGALPVVPLLYHWLTLASPMCASPGQVVMGLTVRNMEDLAPPTPLQALGFTLLLYLTLAMGALWVLVALVTNAHRTFHDMLSGVVVVRTRALDMMHDDWNRGAGYASTMGRFRA